MRELNMRRESEVNTQPTAFDMVRPRFGSPPSTVQRPKRNIQPPPNMRERFITELLPMMYPGRQYTPESLAWRTQIPAGKVSIILRKMARDGLCLTRTSSTFKTVYWVTDEMLSPPLEAKP